MEQVQLVVEHQQRGAGGLRQPNKTKGTHLEAKPLVVVVVMPGNSNATQKQKRK
jgi:hypothetical protein